MSEQPTKEIKVNIDTAPMEDRIKAQYEDKIKEKDELIKSLLARDKQDFVERIEPKKTPEYGETAKLEDEHTLRNVDFENSEFLDMMRFPSVEKAIETTEYLAKKGSPDAVRAMRIMTKKILDKPLDLTFKGSIKEMVKSEVPLGEFDDQYLRKQKEAHNQRLRANRLKWEVS